MDPHFDVNLWSVHRIKESLVSPEGVSKDDINQIHKFVTLHQIDQSVRFDKFQKLIPLIKKLYRAINCSESKVSSQSTNLAEEVSDIKNHKILFIKKSSYLSEKLGIPLSGGGVREMLYYLLDHDNFAGVPPCINVKEGEFDLYNYVYFKKECEPFRSNTKVLIPELRKVFIHQFRTVNMDPTTPNILVKKTKAGNRVFPIDGGYILPTTMKDKKQYFEIAGEPKDSLTTQPFLDQRFTKDELEYILKIDIPKDCKLIEKYLKSIQTPHHEIQDTIKIFTLANRLLKRAAEKYDPTAPVFISLYDLCCFIDIRECPVGRKNEQLYSLFEDLLKSNEEDLDREIDKLFDQFISIKSALQELKDSDPDTTAINIIEKLSIQDKKLKAIVVTYSLGYRRYFQYTFISLTMTKKEVENEFNMRLYNNLKT